MTYTNDLNGVGGDVKFPTSESSVYVQSGITWLSDGESFKVAQFSVGRGWNGYATNIVEGGTLEVTGQTEVSYANNGHGWFDVRSGTVNLGSLVLSGNGSVDGHFSVSGGEVSVVGSVEASKKAASVSDVTLSGGSLVVGGNGYLPHSGACVTTVSGGSMTVNGDLYLGYDAGCGTSELSLSAGGLTVVGLLDVGRSQGSRATMTVSGGELSLGTQSRIGVGASGDSVAAGEMTISGGTVSGGTIHVGYDGGTGVLNVTGGSLTLNNTQYYGALTASYGGDGEINISEDADVNVTGNVFVPRSGTGRFNMSGGTFDLTGRFLLGNAAGASKGEAFVSGGTLTASGEIYVGYGNGNPASLTVSGGSVTADRVILGTDGNADETLTLSGGSLTVKRVYPAKAAGEGFTQQVIFDGGALVAREKQTGFIASGLTLKVMDAGAVIDTDYDVTAVPAFTAADGASSPKLVKKGTGMLTLSADYTLGNLTVVNGTVAFNGGAGDTLAVTFDPMAADLTPGAYTLATGLSALVEGTTLTHALSADSASFYTVAWTFTDGTLVATIDYRDDAVYTITGDFELTNDLAAMLAKYQSVQATGAVTLQAATDLTSPHMLALAADAWIDLNGHDLTLDGYHASAGAVITNSSATAATLRLGANGGEMAGNASVVIGGNLTVSLEGATDTTAFGTDTTFTHTGGWLFKDNAYAIEILPTHLGTGPVTFAGNGGFSANKVVSGHDPWYRAGIGRTVTVTGDNNTIDIDFTAWRWGFLKYAKLTGDGTLRHVGSKTSEIHGTGNNGNADWTTFTGRFIIGGMQMLMGSAQGGDAKQTTVSLDGTSATTLNWSGAVIHLGDLVTESTEYTDAARVAVESGRQQAECYIGYLGNDSTFAGRFASSTYTSDDVEYPAQTDYHKVGTGTWTLNAESENHGAFYVDEGRLNFMRGVTNAAVVVASGATLGGVGVLSGGLTFASGAKLALSSTGSISAPNAKVSVDGVTIVVDDPENIVPPDGSKTYPVLTAKTITGKASLETELPQKGGAIYAPQIVDNEDGTQTLTIARKGTALYIIIR